MNGVNCLSLSLMRILVDLAIGALVPIICCVWLWKIFEYRFYLGQVPEELGVWHITHLTTATYGLGPEGDEHGFVLYALPQSTADDILELGTGWFEQLAPFDRSFDCLEWATTPFRPKRYIGPRRRDVISVIGGPKREPGTSVRVSRPSCVGLVSFTTWIPI